MADFHRKIELQSPEDWQYLVATARRAADAQIDHALPPIQGEDPMRARVQSLVHEYITTLYKSAAHNITINGMEPSSSLLEATLPSAHATVTAGDHIHVVEEHEPFDSKLFARLKDLARQEEDLTETVARLRRVNPGVAVEHARKDWTQGRAEEDAALGVWDEESQTRERMATGLDVAMLERREEVEHASRRSVKHLENLARTLPETVAKKERADRAEAYVRKTAGT